MNKIFHRNFVGGLYFFLQLQHPTTKFFMKIFHINNKFFWFKVQSIDFLNSQLQFYFMNALTFFFSNGPRYFVPKRIVAEIYYQVSKVSRNRSNFKLRLVFIFLSYFSWLSKNNTATIEFILFLLWSNILSKDAKSGTIIAIS